MKIKNRYIIYKKDITFYDCIVSTLVYDLEENDFFNLSFRRTFFGYSLSEKRKIAFDIFNKYLEDKFITFYDKTEFIQQYGIWKY